MKFIMSAAAILLLASPSSRAFTLAFSASTRLISANSRRTVWRSCATTVAAATTSASTIDDAPNNSIAASDSNSNSDSSIYVQEAEALAKVKSPFLQVMRDRGFLHQCTNLVDLDKKLNEGCQAAYLGFDATADSLHVGSLLQIMILRHLQKSGHQPVVLIGGGTSKVGDPTGKDESRVMLNDQIIQKNADGISKVFAKFLHFDGTESATGQPQDAIMVNNDDWLSSLKYLEFLRDYGSLFTVNRMLSFESVKQRLERESAFSFLEFNYMILQAYDFVELYRRHNTILQLGGSDQWGNMVSGTELGRKCEGAHLFALTAPLITTSDGKKMGKTANGAIWLNADRLSQYDYWQFWRNTDDADVIRFLKLFTELPLQDIEQLAKLEGADINKAKITLADAATTMLHGSECLTQIRETVKNMFSGGGSSTESLPRIFVTADEVAADGVGYLDLFLKLKLASSKKEARRLIQGGGARLEGEKITDEMGKLTAADFDGKTEVTLRAGKKRAGVVQLQ